MQRAKKTDEFAEKNEIKTISFGILKNKQYRNKVIAPL